MAQIKKQKRLRLKGLGPDPGGEGGYYMMKIRLRVDEVLKRQRLVAKQR